MKCPSIKDFFPYVAPPAVVAKTNGLEIKWSQIAVRTASAMTITLLASRAIGMYCSWETFTAALITMAQTGQAMVNQAIETAKNNTPTLIATGMTAAAAGGVEIQHAWEKTAADRLARNTLGLKNLDQIVERLADEKTVDRLLQTTDKNILRATAEINKSHWTLLEIASIPNHRYTTTDGQTGVGVRYTVSYGTLDRLFNEIPWSKEERKQCLHGLIYWNYLPTLKHVLEQKHFKVEDFSAEELQKLKSGAPQATIDLLKTHGF